MQLSLQTLVLGHRLSLPREKLKESLLRGEITFIMVAVATTYLISDFHQQRFSNYPYYLLLMGSAVLSFILNRKGQGILSSVLILLSVNALAYVFAASDVAHGSAYLFFLCNALAGFLIFGKRRLFWSLFFAAFAFGVFLLAWIYEDRFVSLGPVPESFVQTNLFINYTVTFCVIVLAVYFLIDAQVREEARLRQSEQALLRANAELERDNARLTHANAELDRFVYGVSHDLKAPLNSITGLVELTQQTHSKEDSQRYLSLITGRVQALSQFIHDLIDLTKNTRTELLCQPIHLNSLVRQTADELQYMSEARDVRMEIRVVDTLVFHSDATRLRLILLNLLANAMKYRDAAKPESWIVVSADLEAAHVKLQVEDNGSGIQSRHLAHVFEMFYRAHGGKSGSGLGLYIVKETITKLGGRVEIQSKPGEGTAVTVWIPSQNPAAAVE
jgi:signal transduction histidine kinase